MRVERRLSAILATDVVGYSRLMVIDEEGTLAALKICRRELLDPKIVEHRGRVVKTTGDSALVEFASAVDATRCAIEIQRAMAKHNASIPEDRRVDFRIGINVGDIIVDDDDIYGDGVNIAARLEAIAEPGGISISEDSWRQVEGKVAGRVVDLGSQNLKNINKRVRVYRIDFNEEGTGRARQTNKRPSREGRDRSSGFVPLGGVGRFGGSACDSAARFTLTARGTKDGHVVAAFAYGIPIIRATIATDHPHVHAGRF